MKYKIIQDFLTDVYTHTGCENIKEAIGLNYENTWLALKTKNDLYILWSFDKYTKVMPYSKWTVLKVDEMWGRKQVELGMTAHMRHDWELVIFYPTTRTITPLMEYIASQAPNLYVHSDFIDIENKISQLSQYHTEDIVSFNIYPILGGRPRDTYSIDVFKRIMNNLDNSFKTNMRDYKNNLYKISVRLKDKTIIGLDKLLARV